MDRGDGPDRAGRRQRPPGRQDNRLPGQGRPLVRPRREAIHHKRLRARAAGAGADRAGHYRRPRPKPAAGGARAEGPHPPTGEQAGHPRQPHLRDRLCRRPGQAHRRAAARTDHLRDEPDERRPHRHCRPELRDSRGRLPRRPRLRPQPQAVRHGHRELPRRPRAAGGHEHRPSGRPGADVPRLLLRGPGIRGFAEAGVRPGDR